MRSLPLGIGFFVLLLPFFVLDREYFERTDIIVHTTPRVTRTYPDAPQTRVPPDTPVWIEFNKRMDISSVEDAILSYPHAVVQVSYYDSSRFLRIEPELGFHHHSRYVSTIPDSARDSQGRWLDRGVNGSPEVSSGSPSTPTHQGLDWRQNCLHLDARSVHDENPSTRRSETQFCGVRGWHKACGKGRGLRRHGRRCMQHRLGNGQHGDTRRLRTQPGKLGTPSHRFIFCRSKIYDLRSKFICSPRSWPHRYRHETPIQACSSMRSRRLNLQTAVSHQTSVTTD